jgi:DNA-binding LacI/PurR family transcriptional regulator
MARSPRDYQIASRYLRSGHVDGAVLVSMHGKRPLDLHSLGVPVVLAGRPFGNGEDLSYVDADNVGGRAGRAISALPRQGTMAGPPGRPPAWTGCAAAG